MSLFSHFHTLRMWDYPFVITTASCLFHSSPALWSFHKSFQPYRIAFINSRSLLLNGFCFTFHIFVIFDHVRDTVKKLLCLRSDVEHTVTDSDSVLRSRSRSPAKNEDSTKAVAVRRIESLSLSLYFVIAAPPWLSVVSTFTVVVAVCRRHVCPHL